MKGLKVDLFQFYLFNYEDWLGVFEEEKKILVVGLSEKERENFNPYHFDYKQTKELFKVYEKIIIASDDTIYGTIGKNHYFIKSKEGLYSFALTYFNKDLSFDN